MDIKTRIAQGKQLLVHETDILPEREEIAYFDILELEDLVKALKEDKKLLRKPVVAVVRPEIPERCRQAFIDLAGLPNVVVGLATIRIHDKLLGEMTKLMPFPIPPFRFFACERIGQDKTILDRLFEIAKSLTEQDSVLRHLSKKWCSWKRTSKEASKRGITMWMLADAHLGELRSRESKSDEGHDIFCYGEYHLSWFSKRAKKLPLAYSPDVVMLLGDMFDKGAYIKSELMNELFQVLEDLKRPPDTDGATVLAVMGEHDCFQPNTNSVFHTQPFEDWARIFQNRGLVTVLSGKHRGKARTIDKKVVAQRVDLSSNNIKGKGIKIGHRCRLRNKPANTYEAMGIVRFQKDKEGIPLNFTLLSSFNPSEKKEPYVDIKGGTISAIARAESIRLAKDYLRDQQDCALNIISMHHAFSPADMELSESTLAYMVRSVGDFYDGLNIMSEGGIKNGVLIHGHTHAFHVSTTSATNLVHIGVPPLGSKYPRDPHGFVVLSLVKVSKRKYALCVGMYAIRMEEEGDVYGNMLLPVELAILQITVDSDGHICNIHKNRPRFKAELSYNNRIPYFRDFVAKGDNHEN